MTTELSPISNGILTDAQHRRAEALWITVDLFPAALGGKSQFDLAHWIITGRLPE